MRQLEQKWTLSLEQRSSPEVVIKNIRILVLRCGHDLSEIATLNVVDTHLLTEGDCISIRDTQALSLGIATPLVWLLSSAFTGDSVSIPIAEML